MVPAQNKKQSNASTLTMPNNKMTNKAPEIQVNGALQQVGTRHYNTWLILVQTSLKLMHSFLHSSYERDIFQEWLHFLNTPLIHGFQNVLHQKRQTSISVFRNFLKSSYIDTQSQSKPRLVNSHETKAPTHASTPTCAPVLTLQPSSQELVKEPLLSSLRSSQPPPPCPWFANKAQLLPSSKNFPVWPKQRRGKKN